MRVDTDWTPGAHIPPLRHKEVQVWCCRIGLVGGSLAHLHKEERAAHTRFVFDEDRARYSTARWLTRTVLGAHLGVSPHVVRWTTTGKPRLEGSRLRFNFSHSGAYALLAVASEVEVGVDVEAVAPGNDLLAMARHYFSPAECNQLMSYPDQERMAAFFRCWTRKEAFIKSTGEGLQRRLDSFDVSLDELQARIVATRPDPTEAARWWLHQIPLLPGHQTALGTETGIEQISCWEFTPMPSGHHLP